MRASLFGTDCESHGRSASVTRRRRGAMWLLFGWLAFWLTVAVQPCELRASPAEDAQTVSLAASDGGHHAPAKRSHEPVPAGDHCPDVSNVYVAVGPAIAAPSNAAHAVHLALSSGASMTRRDRSAPNLHDSYLPAAPPIPRYLRDRRLLI